jgi:hypothetical protein
MAGVLQLQQGADPGTPGSFMEVIWAKSSGTDGNGAALANRLFAKDSSGNLYQLTASDRPNLIRNSGFWWAQRQGVSTATTYSSTAGRALSADGWGITNENASATYIRIDTAGAVESGLQGRYYGQFLKITSAGKLCISQVIEGVDAQQVKNRVMRLQAWMKGAGGGTPTIKFGVLELQNAGTTDAPPATFISAFNGGGTNPTFGTNLAFLPSASTGDNVSITSNVASATLSASWQRFGIAVTVSSNCKNLIPVFFSDQQITATQGFNISQVSLTDGYEVQDWTPLSMENEFARVRRFYQRSFTNEATAPAQNAGVGLGELKGITGKAGAVANSGFLFHRYQPPMRTGPGVTLFNPQAANALMRNITGAADMGATTATGNTVNDLMINATGVAATAVGDQVSIHFTADAEI